MGILILPYWLASLIVAIVAIVKVFHRAANKEITGTLVALGGLISIALFGVVVLSYIIQKKVYALDPPFRIPLYMIILPFVVALSLPKNYVYYANLLLVSTCISAVLIIAFHNFFFKILDRLPVRIYH